VLYDLVIFLLVSAFTIEQSMQWPRLTAIPVIVATIILLLRDSRLGTFHLLENKVATYIGDLSYIIYLWHWPVLVITRSYYSKFGAQEILLVIGLTALLSVFTHHFIENPIRYSQALSRRPKITVVAGVVAITATAALLFTTYQG
jgi:peptidoglycan/LPS O-acetylase OafA/YrhL